MIYRYEDYSKHLHIINIKNYCYSVDFDDTKQIALVKAYLSVNSGGRISVEGGAFAIGENAYQCLLVLKCDVKRV